MKKKFHIICIMVITSPQGLLSQTPRSNYMLYRENNRQQVSQDLEQQTPTTRQSVIPNDTTNSPELQRFARLMMPSNYIEITTVQMEWMALVWTLSVIGALTIVATAFV